MCVYEICDQVLLKFLNTFQSQISTKIMVTASVGRLTTWSRMSLEKLIFAQIIKKLAA